MENGRMVPGFSTVCTIFFVYLSLLHRKVKMTSFKETCHVPVPGSVDIFGFFSH
jgi:hypothetical protein